MDYYQNNSKQFISPMNYQHSPRGVGMGNESSQNNNQNNHNSNNNNSNNNHSHNNYYSSNNKTNNNPTTTSSNPNNKISTSIQSIQMSKFQQK